MLNSQHQQNEAALFAREHELEIAKCKRTVFSASQRFMNHIAPRALPENLVTTLVGVLHSADSDSFGSRMRPHAHRFAGGQFSGLFWSLIDAWNFLGDATGSFWPYVSQDDRLRYLRLAEHEAGMIPCSIHAVA